ncbi:MULTISPECIES: type I-E CRISPR-associated protein Cas6/Cse3/CasE [unclassified Streptomyces]|uniref:type I-E CRISPR-associated protein Cas6/Cse3/CasE n=1 Tax=unclassified Streptomyces TaxID=2593676 RepID=UPI000DC7D46F|nr:MULTISPECIES: type I-E CRISPR-associated protein Cas6/Cse3/CasE [unclassified Streptomyces]AWZ05805.1 type I-E CRISPR-associated protein Cas6/Cse3/CasE [Streptomyces sp. ICC4]AWZ17355.1 type I-E CRISPR-associated protein Cas6/Cse3/CasE [Streptomyces sp. ICC1]
MNTTRVTAARFVATHSVLTLDATHPYVAKSLVDAQEMHRTVMSGFRGWVEDGDPDARSQMGVLSTWSVDLKAAALVLVVQSRVPGDWSRVPRAALTSAPHTLTVDRTVRAGEVLGFRTVINPTRSKPSGRPVSEKARGARVPHSNPEHVKNWFLRRLQAEGEPATAEGGLVRIGATADPAALGVRMLPTVSSPAPHKGLRIARAEIRGSLTVTDPKALVETLSQGLGHARAYSCGLILTR